MKRIVFALTAFLAVNAVDCYGMKVWEARRDLFGRHIKAFEQYRPLKKQLDALAILTPKFRNKIGEFLNEFGSTEGFKDFESSKLAAEQILKNWEDWEFGKIAELDFELGKIDCPCGEVPSDLARRISQFLGVPEKEPWPSRKFLGFPGNVGKIFGLYGGTKAKMALEGQHEFVRDMEKIRNEVSLVVDESVKFVRRGGMPKKVFNPKPENLLKVARMLRANGFQVREAANFLRDIYLEKGVLLNNNVNEKGLWLPPFDHRGELISLLGESTEVGYIAFKEKEASREKSTELWGKDLELEIYAKTMIFLAAKPTVSDFHMFMNAFTENIFVRWQILSPVLLEYFKSKNIVEILKPDSEKDPSLEIPRLVLSYFLSRHKETGGSEIQPSDSELIEIMKQKFPPKEDEDVPMYTKSFAMLLEEAKEIIQQHKAK